MVAQVTPTERMTIAQFMALPAEPEGTTRELINGRVRERDVTTRNKWHCMTEALISRALLDWLDHSKSAQGVVGSGEARCKLTADSVVGIDVAYFGPEHIGVVDDETDGFAGPPILAVEILSPSDTKDQTTEKIRTYLDAGVKQVWVVDTDFQTITVHRPGHDPRLYGASQTLTGDPELPDFSEPVASFFGKGRTRT